MTQLPEFPKVDQFIADDQLGKARDRLHGLLSAQPNNLTIRRRLGDVYSLLDYPEMAGRYWYLEAEKSTDMQAACAEFERSCGGDPLQMLHRLKFRGTLDALSSDYAKAMINNLLEQVEERHGIRYLLSQGGPVHYESVPGANRGGWAILACLGVGVLLLIILALIGLSTVGRLLLSSFA